ncbi:hypothetical protein WDU94_007229 [Cyamophila willieti]
MIYNSNNWGSAAYWNNVCDYNSSGLTSHNSTTHSAQFYKRTPARCSGTNRGYTSEYQHHRGHTTGYQHGTSYHTQPGVPHQHWCDNNSVSRARCSTVKQLLDTYHGVTSSAVPLMPPTSPHQPAASALDPPLQTVALVPSATSAAPPTACQYKPETSLNWEEQFVDLTSFCNSHIQMALIPDEGCAYSSQATEQRNGPDVFFGSDVASGSVLVDMLDTPSSFDSLLYKGASPKCEGDVMGAVSKGTGMPGLKLNVDIGNDTEADLLNTPDVIKAFDDVESFDLIDYVFNQDKKPVLFELDNKQLDDHSDTYSSQDTTLALLLGKQPPAPSKTLPEIKNPLSDNSSIGNTANTQNTLRSGKGLVNKPKQIATIRPKRIKQKKMFDDFVYDTLSPVTVKQEDSEGETPSLVTSTVKKKLLTLPARKRNISCSSTSSSTFSTTKKRRLTDDEDVLEYESGKYRELRNRNNEASRRSRANRKQREQKMKEYSDRLMSDNVRLKSKAEAMERQVEKFRNCLMKIVLSSKKR